ncbi:MAG: UDP-N-acetylmuramate dehydrogenase [Candidatus Gastranaerophilales bacterium]|nr:UDP-N-acetylmuramate dehydrogenase [Candidatus Gastranaerophilales bacterium]
MRIEKDYELKKHTTFQIGGKADIVCFPQTADELVEALKEYPDALVLGNGSDVLISSDGVDGAVIITTEINHFEISGTRVTADCGVKAPILSRSAAEQGLSGMEFMFCIPGTIGGLVYMNASAHSQSIAEIFTSCKVFDIEEKTVKTLKKADMKFAYRKTVLSDKKYIVLSAEFELKQSNTEEVKALMERNAEFRKQKQPSLALPNAGSVFKNPENDSAGRLLEKAGVKAKIIGGAKVWENHANFIVNIGYASSNDVLKLMYKMYNEVKVRYTIELHPEVKFFGRANEEEKEIWQTLTSN